MTLDAESLQRQIPYYLTGAPEQKALVSNLTALAAGAERGYFLSSAKDPFKEEMLQGDGWRGFQVFVFESGERRPIRGIVLSNSCDISPDNERALPPKVVFAPLVRLSAVQARLKGRGLGAQQVVDKIAAIKAQSITSIFYLPADGPLEEGYVALLDGLHSMPAAAHVEGTGREKLFTLSMAGFYMFVFKLSVHLCRVQENVNRSPAAEIGP